MHYPGLKFLFSFTDQGKIKISRSPIIIFDTILMCSGLDTVPTDRKVIKYSLHPTMHLARGNCKRLIG